MLLKIVNRGENKVWLKEKCFKAISLFIMGAVVVVSSSACWILIHQPKEPKCLRKN